MARARPSPARARRSLSAPLHDADPGLRSVSAAMWIPAPLPARRARPVHRPSHSWSGDQPIPAPAPVSSPRRPAPQADRVSITVVLLVVYAVIIIARLSERAPSLRLAMLTLGVTVVAV